MILSHVAAANPTTGPSFRTPTTAVAVHVCARIRRIINMTLLAALGPNSEHPTDECVCTVRSSAGPAEAACSHTCITNKFCHSGVRCTTHMSLQAARTCAHLRCQVGQRAAGVETRVCRTRVIENRTQFQFRLTAVPPAPPAVRTVAQFTALRRRTYISSSTHARADSEKRACTAHTYMLY